jgi:hypothetical protein
MKRLVHAEALHASGDFAGAARAIATARERALSAAAKIADAGARASFLTHVPENARAISLARAWLDDADAVDQKVPTAESPAPLR